MNLLPWMITAAMNLTFRVSRMKTMLKKLLVHAVKYCLQVGIVFNVEVIAVLVIGRLARMKYVIAASLWNVIQTQTPPIRFLFIVKHFPSRPPFAFL
jgi:hypothetical protein